MKIYKHGGPKPMDMRIVESLGEDVIKSTDEQKFTMSSIVSDLIQKEWESVDVVNGYMMVAQEVNSPELMNILNMMLDDKYTQIGQLEGLIQDVVPEAEQIDNAKDDSEIEDVVEL